jgi:SAM-dependent methyltransferase
LEGILRAQERIFAKTFDEVRADHRHRYEWAGKRLSGKLVLDAACGCGYGSAILARYGCRVIGIDNSETAITFAEKAWNRPKVHFRHGDLQYLELPRVDAAVSFETIEHLENPKLFLRELTLCGVRRLIVSVPNEDEFPHAKSGNRFHFRHYTAGDLSELLVSCGWGVVAWYGQADKQARVTEGAKGRTIIADALPC